MATKRIETQISIRAIDKYRPILKSIKQANGKFANGVRSDFKKLENLRGPLKLIEDFKKQKEVVSASANALAKAQSKVHALKSEILRTKNPTAQMRREFERARKAADRMETTHRRNRTALHGMQKGLRDAGVDARHLARDQDRLARFLNSATSAFGTQMDKLQRLEVMNSRIMRAREKMDSSLATAANLSFVGGAATHTGRRILTGFEKPIKKAIDFETAMAGVRKVVDFDSPEAFKKMSDDILELSTRIPMAAEGLAAIVEAGGQSNIPRDELLKFAELAAKVGVAFDVSADMAGTSMAKVKTAMGLTLDETGALFDAMNHLSNNSAAKAEHTLNFLNRAGADGAKGGFDQTETLAMGAAMIAAGAGADTAATSFRNMIRALTKGESATSRQRGAMKRLGLDAAQVSKSMQRDAVGTTRDVFERLNQLPAHLKTSVMSDLFGDEARDLSKLLNNMELLPQMLELVADKQSYLGSAEKEFAAQSETTRNQMQLTQNQLAVLGVEIGETVLPQLKDLLVTVNGITKGVSAWAKEHPKLTKFVVQGGIAVGALAVAGGALLTASAGLIGTLAVVRFGLTAIGARAAFAGGSLLGVRGAMRSLTALPRFALSTLLKPVVWGATLIPRLTAATWTALAGRFTIHKLLYPLVWTGRLIGRIPWVRLAGKLAFTSLITPLVWTKALLPNFAPALLKFTGFRENASREMNSLERNVRKSSSAMGRSMANLGFKAMGASAMMAMAMSRVPKDVAKLEEFQSDNVKSMDRGLRATPGISHLMSGYESLFEWVRGAPPPAPKEYLPKGQRQAAHVLGPYEGRGNDELPTASRIREAQAAAKDLRSEIAGIKSAIGNMTTQENAYDMVSPGYQAAKGDLASKEADLAALEAQIKRDALEAEKLKSALFSLSDTDVMPTVSTESIDRALEKAQQLASTLRSAGGGAAVKPTEVQARASGGPFGTKPLLVGERGPELYYPNRAGFIANNRQLQQLSAAGSAARAAMLGGISATMMAGPAQAAQQQQKSISASVHIGSLHITAPSGVSDPQGLANLVSSELGSEVAGALAAEFSD